MCVVYKAASAISINSPADHGWRVDGAMVIIRVHYVACINVGSDSYLQIYFKDQVQVGLVLMFFPHRSDRSHA